MRHISTTLILGSIVGTSLLTMFLGWQLQGRQCAEIQLPLDTRIYLGETCRAAQ
jgi:hypothetical protein